MKTYKMTLLRSSFCVVWADIIYLLCQFLMVAILKFKMATIILDESHVSRNFLKSSDILCNCDKFHTFITF